MVGTHNFELSVYKTIGNAKNSILPGPCPQNSLLTYEQGRYSVIKNFVKYFSGIEIQSVYITDEKITGLVTYHP